MLRSFIRQEKGGVLILVGGAIFMLVLSVGTAVEMGRAFLLRSKAQSALDAAVLAASSVAGKGVENSELQARAENYFNENFPLHYMGSDVSEIKIAFDETTGKTTGDMTVTYKPAFGDIVKVEGGKLDMAIFSESTRVLGQSLEIALVLDHTSSMCLPAITIDAVPPGEERCRGTTSNTRISRLADAVGVLVDTIDSAVGATESKDDGVYYSYVPFNHDVKLNGDSRHLGADYLPNIMGLRQNGTEIVNAVKMAIINNEGNTNTAVGTEWGWRSLREKDKALFNAGTGSSRHDHDPAPVGDKDYLKAMVILSDGVNEYTYFGRNYLGLPGCSPYGCQDSIWDKQPSGPNPEGADLDQQKLCTAIKDEAIVIYPILYDVDTTTPQGLSLQKIFKDCAKESGGAYFEPKTAEELREAFRKIANTLISLRISK